MSLKYEPSSEPLHMQVVVASVQEACFWAEQIAYPVFLATSEAAFRLYESGQRGSAMSEQVRLAPKTFICRRERVLH